MLEPLDLKLLRDLGRMLREQGQAREADDYFRRALAIFKASLGPDHPDLAEVLDDYARVQVDLGHPTAADSLRRWADRVRPQAVASTQK